MAAAPERPSVSILGRWIFGSVTSLLVGKMHRCRFGEGSLSGEFGNRATASLPVRGGVRRGFCWQLQKRYVAACPKVPRRSALRLLTEPSAIGASSSRAADDNCFPVQRHRSFVLCAFFPTRVHNYLGVRCL